MEYSKKVSTQKLGLVRKFTDAANKLEFENKIYMSIGVPDLPMEEHLKAGVKEAIDKNMTKYTPTAGMEMVKETIAKTYDNFNKQYEITKDNILLTAGSQEAIFLLALSTLEEGDEVIIISPAFFSFKRCATMMGAKVIEVGYKNYDGEYKIPFDELEEKITDKCKYIYINSPNNPTGIVSSEEELKKLTDIARKNDIYILSDEVYKSFVFGAEFHSPIEYYDKVIIVDSISKTFSATGMRIGWIVADTEIINKLIPMHQQVVFSVMSVGQYAVHYALSQPNIEQIIKDRLNVFHKRRDFIYDELSQIKEINVSDGKGAFYLFCELDPSLNISGLDFCYRLLYEKGVVVIPGNDFGDGFENYFRIAYTQDIEKLKTGVDRIREFIEELKVEK